MSQPNLTSEEFSLLIKEGRKTELNEVSEKLCSRMELYLKSVMRADTQVARDCAQAAFEKIYTKLQNDELQELDNFYGYCIRAAKNEWLMHNRSSSRMQSVDGIAMDLSEADVDQDMVEVFHSQEREEALSKCLSELKPQRRQLFLRILNYINHSDKEAASHLDMTHAQFRTKKSRIIAALRKCVDKVLGK